VSDCLGELGGDRQSACVAHMEADPIVCDVVSMVRKECKQDCESGVFELKKLALNILCYRWSKHLINSLIKNHFNSRNIKAKKKKEKKRKN
jgi:hypothetical protein